MKADLHCHSTFSDGVFSPHELVLLAKKKQLDVAVITDHDSFSGYAELRKSAQREGLLCISGIEISSVCEDLSVHVLGYAFKDNSQVIFDYEKRSQEARRVRAKKIIEKLQASGISITEEEVFHEEKLGASIGRPHIARILVKKNYGKTIHDIFDKYLGDKKPAYVPSERISTGEAVQLIHQAGGVAVIAHPQLYRNKKNVLRLLEQYAFDGIEALYCRFRGPEVDFWIRLAEEKKLLVTGGSDFHGEERDESFYGCSLAPEQTVRFLLEHMQKR
jgi:predicted metal-dependent phosphoesterase TrpH